MGTDAASGLAVRVRGLRKVYGDTVRVADVSFDVRAGETFGLLGPNGSGKTTTVECLQGFLRADGGDLDVLGFDPRDDARRVRRLVGSQLHQYGLAVRRHQLGTDPAAPRHRRAVPTPPGQRRQPPLPRHRPRMLIPPPCCMVQEHAQPGGALASSRQRPGSSSPPVSRPTARTPRPRASLCCGRRPIERQPPCRSASAGRGDMHPPAAAGPQRTDRPPRRRRARGRLPVRVDLSARVERIASVRGVQPRRRRSRWRAVPADAADRRQGRQARRGLTAAQRLGQPHATPHHNAAAIVTRLARRIALTPPAHSRVIGHHREMAWRSLWMLHSSRPTPTSSPRHPHPGRSCRVHRRSALPPARRGRRRRRPGGR